jgi:hypothetical protein
MLMISIREFFGRIRVLKKKDMSQLYISTIQVKFREVLLGGATGSEVTGSNVTGRGPDFFLHEMSALVGPFDRK